MTIRKLEPGLAASFENPGDFLEVITSSPRCRVTQEPPVNADQSPRRKDGESEQLTIQSGP